jgi:hypothetical protein
MPTPSALFASCLFSLIGCAMFMYGKRSVNMALIVISLALMSYTWFVDSPVLLYGIGVALCAAAWYMRDGF